MEEGSEKKSVSYQSNLTLKKEGLKAEDLELALQCGVGSGWGERVRKRISNLSGTGGP